VQSAALIKQGDPEYPVNETVSVDVEADTRHTAKDINCQLEQFFVRQKWIPAHAAMKRRNFCVPSIIDYL
jgi:hypothetical protein